MNKEAPKFHVTKTSIYRHTRPKIGDIDTMSDGSQYQRTSTGALKRVAEKKIGRKRTNGQD